MRVKTAVKKNHYLAHVRENEKGNFVVHDLQEHLVSVATLAGQFASVFGNADWAYLAGLWHDLGKYQATFQHMIKTKSGFDPEAHLEGAVGRVDHSTAGAIHAIQRLGPVGKILAYVIAGHHAGLADWNSAEEGMRCLAQRLQNNSILLTNTLSQNPPKEIVDSCCPTTKPPQSTNPTIAALWIRMLFSCLVDADRLDTEKFMDQEKFLQRGDYQALAFLQTSFNAHMQSLATNVTDTPINQLRASILHQCRQKAIQPPGLFSLTVPTGGGKTLSSMAFAMSHAIKHHKRRIIYVIPYTSIIEQTADIFRRIFGESVIEHHSNLESDKETVQSQLACDNWDAPIIVTTSVQFFESLFSAKTGKIRKLHNIANSVVILDEAQLLPPDFLFPITDVMNHLVQHFDVTFVLCTATQPALQKHQHNFRFPGLENVTEIIDKPEHLFQSMKRVEVSIPKNLDIIKTWLEIAQELQKHPTVLCIVNRRDDCRELCRLMPPDTIHLSALMCGEHRSKVIIEIKERLKNEVPIRVISTQLVEAGVDLDFPAVYRALSGLDSIAQAAGRCNREGKMKKGNVVVFVPPRPSPIGHLRQAESCCRQILKTITDDPLNPTRFQSYFQQLYWLKGDSLDKHRIIDDLKGDGKLNIQFRTAADKFRMIDSKQMPVIVRYGEGAKWIEVLKKGGPKKWLLRKLQRYIVNVPIYVHQKLQVTGDVVEVYPGFFAQAYDSLYHPVLGFLANDPAYHEPEELIV
ncbi:MAG: CRISPR-associated helicase Cas3' [Deltaproteobacteria bacterium]|nr:CRISPR-associated helicase Cas3' [Deltaproteobacteria bacterium]